MTPVGQRLCEVKQTLQVRYNQSVITYLVDFLFRFFVLLTFALQMLIGLSWLSHFQYE